MNQASSSDEVSARRRILVVDDDRDFADTLARLLDLEGYEAAPVYNLAAARAKLEGFAAEVALVDIRMDEGSGLDLVSALRRQRPKIICIMMTAYSSVQTAIEALQEGAYDYLRKPFYSEHLLSTLDRCFEHLAVVQAREQAETSLRERNRELEQALENLASSEERLRDVIDNSPSAISLKDLVGRYVMVNKRFEEWYGQAQNDVSGRTSRDIFPAEIARLFTAQWEEVLNSQKVVEEEIEIPFADGQPHTLLVTKFPVIDVTGRSTGVGTIATDVTDSRQAEEQLRQAQKTEALGQLTGGVAHDFNNLLAVISGNLDLMKDDLGSDPILSELLDDALSSAQSGAELTHRLLAFGRRQTLHPQITDVLDLVMGMSRILERTLGETIEVKWLLSDGLPPVEVDRNHLETSLLNLVLNARDAMIEGGVLTIAADRAERVPGKTIAQGADAAGQHVVLSVSDTGSGMPPETLENAIQPFFTTKGAGHGSGLGLSMVYGFVNQSGGHLDISSTVGKGTTVRLYLPRAESEMHAGDATAPAQPPLGGSGERILVVEDKSDVRRLATRILTRLGYEVLEAPDGAKALEVLDSGAKVDLLFTDVVLPGKISGADLALAAQAKNAALRVLYTSGYANNAPLEAVSLRNDVNFIRKPFVKEGLARMVRRALEGSDQVGGEGHPRH